MGECLDIISGEWQQLLLPSNISHEASSYDQDWFLFPSVNMAVMTQTCFW